MIAFNFGSSFVPGPASPRRGQASGGGAGHRCPGQPAPPARRMCPTGPEFSPGRGQPRLPRGAVAGHSAIRASPPGAHAPRIPRHALSGQHQGPAILCGWRREVGVVRREGARSSRRLSSCPGERLTQPGPSGDSAACPAFAARRAMLPMQRAALHERAPPNGKGARCSPRPHRFPDGISSTYCEKVAR